jgi:hypothetical protein
MVSLSDPQECQQCPDFVQIDTGSATNMSLIKLMFAHGDPVVACQGFAGVMPSHPTWYEDGA